MSRSFDDLPPMATDDELVDWGMSLSSSPKRYVVRRRRANRPLVAERRSATVSTEEILLDISDRATEVYAKRRSAGLSARLSALGDRTSTS